MKNKNQSHVLLTFFFFLHFFFSVYCSADVVITPTNLVAATPGEIQLSNFDSLQKLTASRANSECLHRVGTNVISFSHRESRLEKGEIWPTDFGEAGAPVKTSNKKTFENSSKAGILLFSKIICENNALSARETVSEISKYLARAPHHLELEGDKKECTSESQVSNQGSIVSRKMSDLETTTDLEDDLKSALLRHAENGTVRPETIVQSASHIGDILDGREIIFEEAGKMISNAKKEILLSTFVFSEGSPPAETVVQSLMDLHDKMKSLPKEKLQELGYDVPLKVRLIRDRSVGLAKTLLQLTQSKEQQDFLSPASPKVSLDALSKLLDPALIDFQFAFFDHVGPGSNHTKYIITDNEKVLMTSANVQYFPFEEIGTVFTGRPIAQAIREDFADLAGNQHTRVTFSNQKTHSKTMQIQPYPHPAPTTFPGQTGPTSEVFVVSRKGVNRETKWVNTQNPQNDLVLEIIRKAKTNINIVMPNLNFTNYSGELINSIQRGVDVSLVLTEGFNEKREQRRYGQGGTNGSVVLNLLNKYKNLEKTSASLGRLNIRWHSRDGKSKSYDLNGCHSKYISADRRFGLVGSANLDTQSWYFSRELGIGTTDRKIVKRWDDQYFYKIFNRSIDVPSQETNFPDHKTTFPDPKDLKLVRHLGGTTGADLYKDKTGSLFVMKTGGALGSNADGHIENEYDSNLALAALGVPVPEVKLYKPDGKKIFMLSKFIEGKDLQTLRSIPKSPEMGEIKKKLQSHFVADCLLGNYDVFGSSFDNVIIDRNGIPYRIDNGGAFDYRAQGRRKQENEFSNEVSELETMRGRFHSNTPHTNSLAPFKNASLIYSDISDEEIIRQIDSILDNKKDFLNTIPARLKSKMEARIDYLKSYKYKLLIK